MNKSEELNLLAAAWHGNFAVKEAYEEVVKQMKFSAGRGKFSTVVGLYTLCRKSRENVRDLVTILKYEGFELQNTSCGNVVIKW